MQELRRVVASALEPVAIVGLGCRFPLASDWRSYWKMLEEGWDAVREVPIERWDTSRLYDKDARVPGKVVTRWGSFLDDIARFDASFFGISDDEAARIDPQQRLMLEVVWHALEDAGINPHTLAGSHTGVFMGVSHSDYERIIYKELDGIVGHDGPGVYHALTANRVSYALDLVGPSMVVDTACSSSLSALHVACASLRSGECDLAIVGGVNLNLTPEETIGLTKAGMMSPRGRCNSFDQESDGYVRGEGVSAIVLRRFEDTKPSRDHIRALIRGSAVNHNGRSNGLTAPHGPSQQLLLERALSVSGVSASAVEYIEAHAIGTVLGDLIEFRALASVLGKQREEGDTCWLGSCKTNLGHLEAASGIASIIKVALAIDVGKIPPNINFSAPNKYIRLRDSCLEVPLKPVSWKDESLRLAGVSTFGFGGANAHVILSRAEEPREPRKVTKKNLRPAGLWLKLSAHDPQALRELASAYISGLRGLGPEETLEFCDTANAVRADLKERLVVYAESGASLHGKLEEHWDKQGSTLDPALGVFRGQAHARLHLAVSIPEDEGSETSTAAREGPSREEALSLLSLWGVRFKRFNDVAKTSDTDAALAELGCSHLLRIGVRGGERTSSQSGRVFEVSLAACDAEEARRRLFAGAVQSYVEGGPLAWSEIFNPCSKCLARLPLYPFQGDRHWVAPVHRDACFEDYGTKSNVKPSRVSTRKVRGLSVKIDRKSLY